LMKRKADLEMEIDSKLQDLRDSHEQERQHLASEHDVKRQKLNDSHQQHVCVICYVFQPSSAPTLFLTLKHFIRF